MAAELPEKKQQWSPFLSRLGIFSIPPLTTAASTVIGAGLFQYPLFEAFIAGALGGLFMALGSTFVSVLGTRWAGSQDNVDPLLPTYTDPKLAVFTAWKHAVLMYSGAVIGDITMREGFHYGSFDVLQASKSVAVGGAFLLIGFLILSAIRVLRNKTNVVAPSSSPQQSPVSLFLSPPPTPLAPSSYQQGLINKQQLYARYLPDTPQPASSPPSA